MRKLNVMLLCAAAAGVLCGCAKGSADSVSDSVKREFDAWMSVNYPGATASQRGIYILNDIPGDGPAFNAGSDLFAVVSYVWKDLDRNIISSTDEAEAKQLGTYKNINGYGPVYYGPATWALYPGAIYAGIYDAVKDMRVGGTREFISPTWLNTNTDYEDSGDYLRKYSSDDCGVSAILSVTLLDKTSDIVQYQIDSIERYIPRTFGTKVDSSFIGYYYLRTQEPADDLSLKDSTVYINYTGRLLNGLVFDTTIEDTARFYNIYDSGKTYGPQQVSMGSAEDYLTLGSSSSSAASTTSGTATTSRTSAGLIRGFAHTVFNMKHYEKGTCVFVSSYGYSSSGSGKNIPAYAPLRFDIELVDKE